MRNAAPLRAAQWYAAVAAITDGSEGTGGLSAGAGGGPGASSSCRTGGRTGTEAGTCGTDNVN